MSSERGPVSVELAEMLLRCAATRPWSEQDEGPYHRDAQPERRDVTEDRDGTLLQLGIRLADNREPMAGATVEIWHCDALGRYSGFPPPDPAVVATAQTATRGEYLSDQTFLRGSQVTDASGMVEFHTIYPGWYPGRTVHVHLMVHTSGRTYTSQLYFPETISTRVLAAAPYSQRPDRDTTNETDELFPTGGKPAMLDIVAIEDGYRAGASLLLPGSVVGTT